ncbi:MAG: porin [Fluviicoccus sp.]|uniref:porin n=1 Tax=Fluviicoccus sp. TaxID=2003552 RepID=UPI0027238F77|nr:porin [Fluviicoccus sp.]MDO8329035.1 porin [Fluviicoccus sp.]
MNKSLIAISIAAALAAPMANAAPKVYGKLNLSAESYKKDFEDVTKVDEDFTRMVSNASRFGVKGEDELTANLSAIYGIEWHVRADGDSGTDLSERNRFFGIKHQQFGTLKMGKYDTYMKLSQGEVDLFNDFAGDMEWTLAGENRINNVIGYESPKFMNTQINVMMQTQDAATAAKNGNSLSVVHNNEEMGLYLALASDMGIDGKSALFGARESDTLRLTASYKIADLTLNCIYGTSENITGKDAETSMLLGVAYKIDAITLKLQHSTAEADDEAKVGAGKSSERTMSSLGADYNITSKTKAFAWYTTREDVLKGAANDIEETILAVGMEHKF